MPHIMRSLPLPVQSQPSLIQLFLKDLILILKEHVQRLKYNGYSSQALHRQLETIKQFEVTTSWRHVTWRIERALCHTHCLRPYPTLLNTLRGRRNNPVYFQNVPLVFIQTVNSPFAWPLVRFGYQWSPPLLEQSDTSSGHIFHASSSEA